MLVERELLRICCGPLTRLCTQARPCPGLPEKRHRDGWCILLPQFPLLSRCLGFRRRLIRWLTVAVASDGRVGTSPVKLTNHFPEANPPTTLTLDRRLTVSAAGRRSSRCRSPCFTISRKLALRLGRIVNPPRVLLLGSFAATF